MVALRALLAGASAAWCVDASTESWRYSDQDAWKYVVIPSTGNTSLTNECGSKGQQSPIDIDGNTVFYATGDTHKVLQVEDGKGLDEYSISLRSLSHTWEVDFTKKAPSVTYQGRKYLLRQFNFHSPSEHTIDGQYYPMEMHLMHSSPDFTHILAIAVMFQVGSEPHPYLENFWYKFPLDTTATVPATATSPLRGVLPSLGHLRGFMSYEGSLTTPPCSLNTSWIVMTAPAYLSEGQLNDYRAAIHSIPNNSLQVNTAERPAGLRVDWNALLGVNNRKTQPIGSRTVTYYMPSQEERVWFIFDSYKFLFLAVAALWVASCIACLAFGTLQAAKSFNSRVKPRSSLQEKQGRNERNYSVPKDRAPLVRYAGGLATRDPEGDLGAMGFVRRNPEGQHMYVPQMQIPTSDMSMG